MKHSFAILLSGAVLWAAPVASETVADIYFLGEIHDNPGHHERQADWVARLAPAALVFEMIPETHTPTKRASSDPAAFGESLAWEERGWPAFDMYWPIFAAAPNAQIYGAGVDRQTLMSISEQPLAQAFGDDASEFNLNEVLPVEQQEAREALQFAAHCDALPSEMLPMMVDMQRWRDGALARAAKRALKETGGPVAVITGNGHARLDWGAPTMLGGVRVFALGQGEGDAAPNGTFDETAFSPAVERPDPCEAFR